MPMCKDPDYGVVPGGVRVGTLGSVALTTAIQIACSFREQTWRGVTLSGGIRRGIPLRSTGHSGMSVRQARAGSFGASCSWAGSPHAGPCWISIGMLSTKLVCRKQRSTKQSPRFCHHPNDHH